MKLLELNTGLFPDAQTVIAALRCMEPAHEVVSVDIRHRPEAEEEWDQALAAILSADRIITL